MTFVARETLVTGLFISIRNDSIQTQPKTLCLTMTYDQETTLCSQPFDAYFVTAVAGYSREVSRNAESYYVIQIQDMGQKGINATEAFGL